VLLFAAWRIARGGPLLKPTLLAAVVLFVPWALLQQALFQFYLLGRVRALLASAPGLLVAAVNGLFFGAVHLPKGDLTLVTIVAGSARPRESWRRDQRDAVSCDNEHAARFFVNSAPPAAESARPRPTAGSGAHVFVRRVMIAPLT
jgi:hypothetical protein